MNVSRMFLATAATLSVLAAAGCTAPQTAPEVATAPMVVPTPAPEQVAVAETMPSHPALQKERPALPISETPVYVAPEPAKSAPSADFTERPPQADRN
jgi:hypothetical protein